eukprot:1178369-Prorocentrum_minimum.AAC.1
MSAPLPPPTTSIGIPIGPQFFYAPTAPKLLQGVKGGLEGGQKGTGGGRTGSEGDQTGIAFHATCVRAGCQASSLLLLGDLGCYGFNVAKPSRVAFRVLGLPSRPASLV